MSEFVKKGLYPTEHTWSMQDILHSKLDYSKFIKSTIGGNSARRHNCASKARLAQVICSEVVRLVLEDVIKTGNIFQLPVMQGAYIKIVEKEGGKLNCILRQRKWNGNYYKDLDMFGSDGKIYEMILEFYVGKYRRERMVWLDRRLFDLLVKMTSEGKRYLKR